MLAPAVVLSNNSANSHPSLGALNRRVLRACLVPQCSYPPHRPPINDTLRIATRCLRPTPADNLPTLAGIQPAALRRNGATLSLACRAVEPGHLLHLALTRPSSANARRLKSRHPFVPAAQHLISLSDNNNIRGAQLADYQWNAEWTAPQGSAFSSPTPAPTPRNDPPKKSLDPA